jgi:DNA (cytosine-5)-methyltransferase 1
VEEMNPTVISTFAGCGGSSLGYKLAGFHELLAVEWEQNAVDTFRLNFPDVPVFHGDIAKLSVDECLRLAGGIKPGELDVFDGSPPCQGFSTAGKRKFDDPRNSLFKEFARLLEGLQPKVFVMENVTGMVKGAMKQAYLQIVKTLRECGYQVKGEVMNAMYYNVPQSRERVIIIGVRNDIGILPSHPKPQTRQITIRKAWSAPTDISGERGTALNEKASMLASLIPQGDSNGGGKYSLGLFGNTNSFGLTRLSWNRCGFTLPKTSIITSCILHPDCNNRITINQAKRIASFPDDFVLQGDFTSQWARIGNSVPPNLMRAIAEHIKREILEKT